MCEVAGDGVLLNWPTPRYAEEPVAAIRKGIAKSGEPGSVEIASYVRVSPSIANEASYKATAMDIAAYVSRPIYGQHFQALGYDVGPIATAFAESAERGAAVVSDSMLDAFSAVGRDASERRLREYREIGISLPVLAPIASFEPGYWQGVMDLVSD